MESVTSLSQLCMLNLEVCPQSYVLCILHDEFFFTTESTEAPNSNNAATGVAVGVGVSFVVLLIISVCMFFFV